MKILQICSAREIGGGERHLADLANALTTRGHDVYAAVIPDSPLIPELHSIPKKNIIEVRMRSAFDLSAAAKLARIVRESEIDVIHAHVARDYPLAAIASRRSGNTPLVLTRHVLFPLSGLHRFTFGKVSRFIAVSHAVAESLRARPFIDPNKVVAIHNGIDPKRFACESGQTSRPSFLADIRSPLLIGMVGHIDPIKGQEDFIRAAAVIASRRDDVEFALIGEDKSRSGDNRKVIEALIAKLDLAAKVHLIGWQDDVAPFLHHLDVFVSPSRSEPFGLVILEAFAAGVTVIATRSEGAVEIIENGVTGNLVPIGDTEALAARIVKLLDDPADRTRLSANALQAVNERFSLDRMVDETEKVYREVIKT